MIDYRLYFLDSAGHIVRAVEMQYADDEEAILAVEVHRDGSTMELWNRERRVREFSAREREITTEP